MIAEADMGMTQRAMDEHDRHRGDENLYVRFFNQPIENRAKSVEEGRPIYVDTECIHIMVPGDKGNVIMREVRDSDRRRFPKQHAAYKNDSEELLEGTPLSKWGMVTDAQAEELKFFGIRTVEQLASVSDSNAQKFMGINILRENARTFVEASKSEAPMLQLQDELSKRDATIGEQTSLIEDLQKRLVALETNVPEKKGLFGG